MMWLTTRPIHEFDDFSGDRKRERARRRTRNALIKAAFALFVGFAMLGLTGTEASAQKKDTPICLKPPPKSVTPSAIKASSGYLKRQRKETRGLVAVLRAQTKERQKCLKEQERALRSLEKEKKALKRKQKSAEKKLEKERKKLASLEGQLESLNAQISSLEEKKPKSAAQKRRGIPGLKAKIARQNDVLDDDGRLMKSVMKARANFENAEDSIVTKKSDVKNALRYLKAHRSFIKKAKSAGKKARSKLQKEANKSRRIERMKNPVKWAKSMKKSSVSLIKTLNANKDWFANADALKTNYQKRADLADSVGRTFVNLQKTVKNSAKNLKKADKAVKKADKALKRSIKREDQDDVQNKYKSALEKAENNKVNIEEKVTAAKQAITTNFEGAKKKYKALVKGAAKFEVVK